MHINPDCQMTHYIPGYMEKILKERERYRKALEEIANNPFLNPEANSELAKRALSEPTEEKS